MPAFSAIAWIGCMVAAWAISISLGTGDLRMGFADEVNASSFVSTLPRVSLGVPAPGGIMKRLLVMDSTGAWSRGSIWSRGARRAGRTGRRDGAQAPASGAAEPRARRRLRGLVHDLGRPPHGGGHAPHVFVLGRHGGELAVHEAQSHRHIELADPDRLVPLLRVQAPARHHAQTERRGLGEDETC